MILKTNISGANNLADTISRNPAGLNDREIKQLSEPRGIIIAAIDLNIDKYVARKLGLGYLSGARHETASYHTGYKTITS
jgi:hypothetical protein